MLRALSLAYEPRPIDPKEHDVLVERALAKAPRARRGVVVRVTFGVAAVLAVAAAILLFVGRPRPRDGGHLALTRSTQPLFTERFAPPEGRAARGSGEESARVNRIAMARASDWRENRFAMWGVR